MRNTTFAIITAVGASLCCTGPILFASLGATSLSGFSLLEPLRPYLSLMALGLLGFAFWRSYRPAANEACCTIEDRYQLGLQRATLWAGSLLVGAFLLFPSVNAEILNTNDTDAVVSNHASDGQSTWIVEGMTCSGCALGLEASLVREEGMEYCKVRYEEGQMECRVDGDKLKEPGISDLVALYGYKAKSTEAATNKTL